MKEKITSLEREFSRELKNDTLYKAHNSNNSKKPLLYVDISSNKNSRGWHGVWDDEREYQITTLFGTDTEVLKLANIMYGNDYTVKLWEGQYPYSYGMEDRKKKSSKSKSTRKIKCRCK